MKSYVEGYGERAFSIFLFGGVVEHLAWFVRAEMIASLFVNVFAADVAGVD